MNITLNIEADSSAELQEAINGLARGFAVITGGADTPKLEPEKTKRSNKVATQPEKAPETEQAVEPAAVEETPPVEVPPAKTPEEIPTVVELRAEAQKHGQSTEGKKAIKAILTKFGSESISKVTEDNRTACLQALVDLGKKAEKG